MNKKEPGFSKEFFIVLVMIIITFFFLIHEINKFGVNQISLDSEELKKENKLLLEKIENIRDEITLLETDQGIEIIARKKLRLVKPGEIIIMEYSGKKTKENQIIE